MARWQPNAPERLAAAALELFEEHGYDGTTVAQITERAGLTKSAFFRHFADKREVLSNGAAVTEVLLGGIAQAPREASLLDSLTLAFVQTGAEIFTPERHDFLARRWAVVARTPELREREALKELGMVAALADALRRRGASEAVARVVAELGALAFQIAYGQWLQGPGTASFEALVRKSVDDVRAAAAAI